MRRLLALWLGCAAALVLAGAAPAAEPGPPPAMKWLWVYAPVNFQADKQVDDFLALLERSKKAGYNGMLISDYKWGLLKGRPANYFTNMERTRKAAQDAGMELILGVMPIGYSNSLLMNNPNLAEGIAVRDCAFAVKGREATVADTTELLPGGGFEEDGGKKLAGWDWADECVKRDTEVKHSGKASARVENSGAGAPRRNGRLVRKLTLKPWHEYHVSLWIKTQDVARPGAIDVKPLAAKRCLSYTALKVKPTQDWTEHHIIFNTLENTEVGLYVGIWGGSQGKIWFDEVGLKETAGVNLLRSEGCPLKVTSEDGKTEYAEGRDFEKWEYPKLGRVPSLGGYEAWHPPPPVVIKDGSRIRDGDTLKVSFYHTVVIHDGQVPCCLRSEELFGCMENQVRDLKRYFAPKKYFMGYDEIRVAGQCALCRREGETAGQVLAENVRRSTAIIRKVDPQAEIFTWSDMFDPNHNAVDDYYLVGSTFKGSWEGLDKDVRIGAWYFEKRDQSLPFFAARGHMMFIAGYYDDSAHLKENVDAWLKAAAKVKGVEGIMYTTWRNNYSDLEKFADAARSAR
jgi:hypothetical protein